MKLLNKTIEKRFAKIGSQEDKKDPIVVVKFFNPVGAGTWWATELVEYRMEDPKGHNYYTKSYKMKESRLKKGWKVYDVIFYGYVSIFNDHCDEWGSFCLSELESIKGWGGLGIERDLHCGEQKISKFNIKTLSL